MRRKLAIIWNRRRRRYQQEICDAVNVLYWKVMPPSSQFELEDETVGQKICGELSQLGVYLRQNAEDGLFEVRSLWDLITEEEEISND